MKAKFISELLNESQQWILTIEDLADLLSRVQLEDMQPIARDVLLKMFKEVYKKQGNKGVVREFNKTAKGDVAIKAYGPARYVLYYDFMEESLDEYMEGERQEGQRWRSPDQVDYPLAEEEDEEIEEDVNTTMPTGPFYKPHHDYHKVEEELEELEEADEETKKKIIPSIPLGP